MNSGIIVAIVVAALIVIAAIAWLVLRKRRSEELKEQFGQEYDRTVEEVGDQRRAESLLVERRERVDQVDTRALSAEERQRFTGAWREVQVRFVDDPAGAIGDADQLIADVMKARGYPAEMATQYEQRTDVVSVEHPGVVNDYRTAHEISVRNDEGDVTTEDLRAALLRYRSIFETLVTEPVSEEVSA